MKIFSGHMLFLVIPTINVHVALDNITLLCVTLNFCWRTLETVVLVTSPYPYAVKSEERR